MGDAQFIAMFCVDALAEFQHAGDDQLVFVGEEQREGLSAGDLGDREGKQRFDNDGGELCAISHGSIHSHSPCPDPIGRSIRCHTRRPSRSSRETASGSVRKPPASHPSLVPTAQISFPLSLCSSSGSKLDSTSIPWPSCP